MINSALDLGVPAATMSEAVVENNFFEPSAVAATVNSRAFKRDQVPADLVGTLAFLCSSDSDFMTGQTLVCDGGSVMH
jgi:NAD(P)-dependent dehydrogenase (short-subunit alcohol dehydrogenase family)